GLGPNAKVMSIAGKPVSNWPQLGNVIRAQPAGTAIPVVVQRDGRTLTLMVTPGTVPGRHGSYLGVEDQIFQRIGPVSGIAYAGSTWWEVLEDSGEAAAKLPAALPALFAKDRAKTP